MTRGTLKPTGLVQRKTFVVELTSLFGDPINTLLSSGEVNPAFEIGQNLVWEGGLEHQFEM